jgi:hypothetical protein
VAEGVGFEPTVRFPVRLISSQVPSTAQPPFHLEAGEHSEKALIVEGIEANGRVGETANGRVSPGPFDRLRAWNILDRLGGRKGVEKGRTVEPEFPSGGR